MIAVVIEIRSVQKKHVLDARGVLLFGSQSLSVMVKAAAKEAGLPPACVPHGLRKAMTRRLAEGGATAKQIASISGHKSLREIERYTDRADQRQLSKAAMNKLFQRLP